MPRWLPERGPRGNPASGWRVRTSMGPGGFLLRVLCLHGQRREIRTPCKLSPTVRSCRWSRSLSRTTLCRLFSLSVSITVWCSPGESKCQRKGFNALHYFCPRFLPANLHFTSLFSYHFSSSLHFPMKAFFSLTDDVKQIPNVIFSADARKLEEVYYSSVRYSFQRKLLVRSIYLALCTSLILTWGLL